MTDRRQAGRTFRPATRGMLLSLFTLALLCGGEAAAQTVQPEPSSEDSTTAGIASYVERESTESIWQYLGSPYINTDSDYGIVAGVAAGVARPPNVAMIVNTSAATSRQYGASIRGEAGNSEMKYVLRLSGWHQPLKLYPSDGVLPDWHVKAFLERGEAQAAVLFALSPTVEAGPEALALNVRGVHPTDADGSTIPISTLPRLLPGSLLQAGMRARWHTTSTVRPTNGYVLDATVRGGLATGELLPNNRGTGSADLLAAWAKPLYNGMYLYLRGWARYQDIAAPSVRNTLGGIYTLRGQPTGRDAGRRLLAGRAQLHWTAIRHVSFLGRMVNWALPFVPVWNFEFELAPFADVGAVADPDYGGWLQTRQGYGISFRLVLPPSLVFSIDLAASPGGRLFYYFGGGESL